MGAVMNWLLLDLQICFFLAALITTYWFIVRPILKTRPGCLEFYQRADSFWAAVRLRFQGLKGAIATGLAKAAAVVIYLHDEAIPYMTGVDWTPITDKVPAWAWPILCFAAFWFIGQARVWAERRA